MKTAMQEMIDYLLKWDKEGEENFDALMLAALVKAKRLLEKEKEQLIEAVENGGNMIGGEEYYNETYNQNK